MKNVHCMTYRSGSKEEMLPNFSPDFPYIASRNEIDRYMGGFVPWHWHKEVELFYMESGVLEYYTPKGTVVFPAGTGGLVNSNILHMTRPKEGVKDTTQFLHIFDTSFIGGRQGSRIEQKYIAPLLLAPQAEIIALFPDFPEQARLLKILRDSFELSDKDFAYEVKLRAALSDIWCGLFTLAAPLLKAKTGYDKANDKIKLMMVYIHEHYTEKISVSDIASAGFISVRECFRVFQNCLHVTPAEYLKTYRLQNACQLLAGTSEPVTFIGQACGLGSSSYFGKVFREFTGYTPLEYRRKWQDCDINWQS